MQIEVPPNEREKLKAEIPPKFAPQYELFVFDESLFETKYVPNDPAYSDQKKSWYLHAVKAPQAWAVTRGLPKHTVAIVDNGFNLKHPELKDKVVMPYNVWLHSDKVSPQKIDHGTHVAGTALAIAGNKKGLLGIAPNCAFMPVQVASAQGVMTTTSILDGILYALYQGADVVNVSLGADFSGLNSLPEEHQREIIRSRFKEEERVWDRIVKIADKHGAVIVTAAGNDNVLAGISPLQRPGNIITVSALDKQNQSAAKASFSNYGEYSTISAPGVDIYSTIGSGGYTMMDGTSMASPIVAGGVALMKSLNDSLTARQIICILQNTGLSAAGDVGKLIQLDKALEAVISGETAACAEPLAYCNTAVAASGGDEGYIGSFQMGQKSGTFVFRHNTHNVPDRITIHDGPDTEGNVIFTYSGGTRGVVNAAVKFNQPVITVEIISLGTGTAWDFVVNCPAGQAAPGPGVSAGQNPPGVGAPVGQTPPGYGAPPPAGRNPPAAGVPPGSSGMDDLQRERDRLQRRLDEIDKVLKTGN
ncbi:MAG: S8 family serine peptidase [Chitinispirillia bacterium]|nr:S8 family serine peptidase [Chitinispirillia bacterium]MCL2241063.1 S8 family serine peptidase [Chitinispirillia bacterium]